MKGALKRAFFFMKKVLIGISGGVAAYKAASVVSRLTQAGHDVRVVMTDNATRFVTPLTFAALTRQKVLTTVFPNETSGEKDVIYPHLYPATEADLFVVLPATANIIAKLANGIGDDILTTSALSLDSDCQRFFCPAMNAQMWNQPVVQDNVAKLKGYRWTQIGPNEGVMACGDRGAGRMSEPEQIIDILTQALNL
jgi:phosphopantothenoylcysteine synthetase/decarboxylase